MKTLSELNEKNLTANSLISLSAESKDEHDTLMKLKELLKSELLESLLPKMEFIIKSK